MWRVFVILNIMQKWWNLIWSLVEILGYWDTCGKAMQITAFQRFEICTTSHSIRISLIHREPGRILLKTWLDGDSSLIWASLKSTWGACKLWFWLLTYDFHQRGIKCSLYYLSWTHLTNKGYLTSSIDHVDSFTKNYGLNSGYICMSISSRSMVNELDMENCACVTIFAIDVENSRFWRDLSMCWVCWQWGS